MDIWYRFRCTNVYMLKKQFFVPPQAEDPFRSNLLEIHQEDQIHSYKRLMHQQYVLVVSIPFVATYDIRQSSTQGFHPFQQGASPQVGNLYCQLTLDSQMELIVNDAKLPHCYL